jgi:DNA-binding NtrC family response regulator
MSDDTAERIRIGSTDAWHKTASTADRTLCRLVVSAGTNRGAALTLSRARATVGRHPTNDLVIDDAGVSAVHLELERRPSGRVYVRDAKSTNGTWFGGHRLVEMELGPGAVIQVGSSTLSIELDGRATVTEPSERVQFGRLVGDSPEMRELFAVLARVAPKALSLLVQGETGTGKEEVARAIHAASPRASGPFVVLDCTTIPPTLAESMLFGHERGAFTGAESRHLGAFERAHRGTIFIDEVGELPLDLQPKLLRVLERRELSRVGSTEPIPIDVRVVAATHRDLRLEIERGRFREDLYFRLAQVRAVLPPLRARSSDIEALARHFVGEISAADGRAYTIEADALAELSRMPFPGNVRELRNVVLRGAALSEEGRIRVEDLAGEHYGHRDPGAVSVAIDAATPFSVAKQRAVDRFERAYLEALMRRAQGNLSRASREADLARHHLRELLRKHDLYDGGAGNTNPPPPPSTQGV